MQDRYKSLIESYLIFKQDFFLDLIVLSEIDLFLLNRPKISCEDYKSYLAGNWIQLRVLIIVIYFGKAMGSPRQFSRKLLNN
jgi:hypothetical protein